MIVDKYKQLARLDVRFKVTGVSIVLQNPASSSKILPILEGREVASLYEWVLPEHIGTNPNKSTYQKAEQEALGFIDIYLRNTVSQDTYLHPNRKVELLYLAIAELEQ